MSGLSPSNGAFVFPATADAVLGNLSVSFDEVNEGQIVVDTSEAVAAQSQQNLTLEQYLSQLQVATFTGVTDGTGSAFITHGLANADRRCYYAGGSARFGGGSVPLLWHATTSATVTFFPGTIVAANAPFFAVMLLLPNPLGW